MFYYCVHGETLFNNAKRMQGWCDSPLTDNGRNQMLEAAKALRAVPFSAAYVSTGECARDSVEILMSGRDFPVTCLKSLKEEFYGTMEGVLISSAMEEIETIRKNTRDWSRYGGESRENIRHRISEIFRKIYERSQDMDRILIVSHSEIFLDLLNVLLQIPYEKIMEVFPDFPISIHGFAATFCCREGEWELLSVSGGDNAALRKLREPSGKKLSIS